MKIFISYSHKDRLFFDDLCTHLKAATRLFPDIKSWEDTQIRAGEEWRHAIKSELNAAEIILLLVSPDFMASKFIWDEELTPALKRQQLRDCVVAPIILRSTPFWQESAFGHLQALPTGGKHVKSWADQDEAWTDVVEGICNLAKDKRIQQHQNASKTSSDPLLSSVQDLRLFSSEEMRSRVANICARMRSFEAAARDVSRGIFFNESLSFEEHCRKMSAISNEHNNRWRSELCPEAVSLWNELRRRLYGPPPYPDDHRTRALNHGMLAGVAPLHESALVLEELARRLP